MAAPLEAVSGTFVRIVAQASELIGGMRAVFRLVSGGRLLRVKKTASVRLSISSAGGHRSLLTQVCQFGGTVMSKQQAG